MPRMAPVFTGCLLSVCLTLAVAGAAFSASDKLALILPPEVDAAAAAANAPETQALFNTIQAQLRRDSEKALEEHSSQDSAEYLNHVSEFFDKIARGAPNLKTGDPSRAGSTLRQLSLIADSPEERVLARQKAVTVFVGVLEHDPQDEFAWTGLGDTLREGARPLAKSDPERSQEYFAWSDSVFARSVAHAPRSVFLWQMWASNDRLRARDVLESEAQRALFAASVRKFQIAVFLDPADRFSWDGLDVMWGELFGTEQADESDKQTVAYRRFSQAHKRGQTRAVPYLAAVMAALAGDDCRNFLVLAASRRGLPSADVLRREPAFAGVRGTTWFEKLLAKADKK